MNTATRLRVSRHVLDAPALVDGRVAGPGPKAVVLGTGASAYVIVDGTDVSKTDACPAPYQRFEVRLPGTNMMFELPARVPNAWDYFPAYVPVGTSLVLPAADIIPELR